MKQVRKGEVYFAKLSPVQGSEQDGTRPVLIIQNNKANKSSPTTIIVPITSVLKKPSLPTHVVIREKFLYNPSMVLVESIRHIDKSRLLNFVGVLDNESMKKVEAAICDSLEINQEVK